MEEAKKPIINIFTAGCKRGFYIGVEQILPAMILGYVIVQFLQLTGIVDLLSNICGPVMKLFGLPGEAVVVLISAFFAKAAGAGTAANLFVAVTITAAQATILIIPCMCMGTLVGHFARIVLVAGTNTKYSGLLLLIPFIESAFGMLLMRLILSLMGLM